MITFRLILQKGAFIVLAVHLIMVCLFILLSIVFFSGKGAFLIAGYNTLSPNEQDKIEEAKLCRFMGKFMLVLAACWLVAALSEIFQVLALLWAGIALFFIAVIAGVLYANTGNRFKK